MRNTVGISRLKIRLPRIAFKSLVLADLPAIRILDDFSADAVVKHIVHSLISSVNRFHRSKNNAFT